MACSDFSVYYKFLSNGQFFDAFYCVYADSMGPLVFGLLVYAPLAVALYVYSDSVMLPLVLTMVVGGVVVSQLPAGAVQILGAVALLGFALAVTLLARRLRTP